MGQIQATTQPTAIAQVAAASPSQLQQLQQGSQTITLSTAQVPLPATVPHLKDENNAADSSASQTSATENAKENGLDGKYYLIYFKLCKQQLTTTL